MEKKLENEICNKIIEVIELVKNLRPKYGDLQTWIKLHDLVERGILLALRAEFPTQHSRKKKNK